MLTAVDLHRALKARGVDPIIITVRTDPPAATVYLLGGAGWERATHALRALPGVTSVRPATRDGSILDVELRGERAGQG